MIKPGDKIDLDLPVKSFRSGEKWVGTMAELITRLTIVSVYMRNNTGSCDQQIQQLNSFVEEASQAEIDIVGLSRDTLGSHSKYACKLELKFPLVSDPDYVFAKATDSLLEKKLYGRMYKGPSRSAYLIGKNGTVRSVIEKVDSANHAEQLRELIKSLK